MFDYSRSRFEEIARFVLDHAAQIGASAASVDVSEESGLAVTVRKGAVDTLEQTRDKALGVTVHLGARRGHAATSDFSSLAIREAVRAAYDIARFTGDDECGRLPDADRLARDIPDLDLFHPWMLSTDEAIALALETEQAAFATDRAIVNSDGASVSVNHGHFISANSLGFIGGYPFSRHALSCAPIAGRGRAMQRDDWYSAARQASKLADPKALGRYAAERALSRLGARKLSSRKVPVLFESPLACGLMGHFVQAASGGSLYRKASFLLDALGTQVFAPHLDLHEDPHQPGAFGSQPFDDEGVATAPRTVVSAGILEGWFLSSYSARKLGLQTTGNAGGAHALRLSSRLTRPGDDLRAMLRALGTGLFVTELLGHGVNGVTGDYSRGASGYWVEGGEIQYPVEEITIAGSLPEMFRRIVGVGADEIVRGSRRCGSILIEEMAVGG